MTRGAVLLRGEARGGAAREGLCCRPLIALLGRSLTSCALDPASCACSDQQGSILKTSASKAKTAPPKQAQQGGQPQSHGKGGAQRVTPQSAPRAKASLFF